MPPLRGGMCARPRLPARETEVGSHNPVSPLDLQAIKARRGPALGPWLSGLYLLSHRGPFAWADPSSKRGRSRASNTTVSQVFIQAASRLRRGRMPALFSLPHTEHDLPPTGDPTHHKGLVFNGLKGCMTRGKPHADAGSRQANV